MAAEMAAPVKEEAAKVEKTPDKSKDNKESRKEGRLKSRPTGSRSSFGSK